jgi:hypothetical protein
MKDFPRFYQPPDATRKYLDYFFFMCAGTDLGIFSGSCFKYLLCETHHSIVARIAEATSRKFVSVEYRLKRKWLMF